ncbi:Homeobox and c2h2 transcription [Fusarium keratoplasticum]|uniref:Homeobox and c2h2 transcription n=1 Tax=Fusarium keratoplasticum TaxID=1328300 RepID=A0ACC0R5S5_9HYPO|nr:Homeobox and c2h2 transcription [Fusarium keratoplasticum]KAI8675700.1 Homeobox and c2h2 transcription [Fusarium keratoplasticum]
MSSQAASVDEASAGSSRPKIVRHKKSSTKILKEWFASHTSHPYPTDGEKEDLAHRTGLSARQVSYWFINARRRRGDKPGVSARASHATLSSQSLPISSTTSLPGAWETLSPMDRWRHSPPEDEPGSWSAITEAVADSWLSDDFGPGPRGLSGWSEGSNSLDFTSSHNQSASSSASSSFSHSAGSIASSESRGSVQGPRHRPPRRRQKRQVRQGTKTCQQTQDVDRIYQCTFCTDTFKSRYDWTRHEGTLHLVLERWTCLPFGPRLSDESNGVIQCALCGQTDPSESHLESHHIQQCVSKPLRARTFYRKDHLRQHLRGAHRGDKVPTSTMDAWKTKITKVNARCGFCGDTFQLWADRNDHLADHFRSGALMKDWNGCRGLDPAVALLVENAIPPYLIGQQSRDLEPFSATKIAQTAPVPTPYRRCPPTSFELLTARLGEFVTSQRASQGDVSDECLRRQSRLILFDDDDPWNQTPADNPDWLRMFKMGYGLADDSVMNAGPLLDACPSDLVDPTGLNSQRLSVTQCSVTPFTPERMRQAAVSDSSSIPLDLFGGAPSGEMGFLSSVPWSWQTPECLAEFSQMANLLPQSACDIGGCTGSGFETADVDSANTCLYDDLGFDLENALFDLEPYGESFRKNSSETGRTST